MPYYDRRAVSAPILINDTSSCMVVINGVSVTIVAGTLIIDAAIGKRSTASFTAYNTAQVHFQQYQQVLIIDRLSTLIFSGYITNPQETQPGWQKSLLTTITCCDQHFLADKRVIAAIYANQTPAQIVTQIANTILAQEGVSVGMIYDPNPQLFCSPLTICNTTLLVTLSSSAIASAIFSYCSVAAALDSLVQAASASGIPYYWQIDALKRLWFVPYTMIVNPVIVDGTKIDQVYSAPTVTRANPTYRNTQYLLGGVAQTLQQIETRVGDGTTASWTMGYALAAAPAITIDGIAQTVGVKGSSGFQFYWALGDPVITQDSSGLKLSITDTLQVIYIGQYATVISTASAGQIGYEEALDGTTGIIEEVETDPTVSTATDGFAKASNLLTRYATQGIQFVFSTLVSTYAQGQLITVNYAPFGFFNAQMIVEEVSISDQVDSFNLWYTVTGIIGPYDVTWTDFFATLLGVGQQPANISIGVSQSLSLLASFSASAAPSATFTTSITACPIVNTTTLCNTTLIVC